MHKPLVSKQWRLQLLRFRILVGSDWALILWFVSRAIDGVPGASLSLRHGFLKSELTVVSGVWHLSRSIYSYEAYSLYSTELFVCVASASNQHRALLIIKFAIIQSVLAQDSIQVLLSCLCVFQLSRCQVAIRNTTSMAVLTWLTSWRGALLILLAGNVSGHHPSSIVWSGTADPTTLMSRILQVSAV